MPTHTLHDCYNAIIRAGRLAKSDALIQYAVIYSQTGLGLPDAANYAECLDAARIQARYVRANLSGWRGDEARAIRTALDKIITIPRRSK